MVAALALDSRNIINPVVLTASDEPGSLPEQSPLAYIRKSVRGLTLSFIETEEQALAALSSLPLVGRNAGSVVIQKKDRGLIAEYHNFVEKNTASEEELERADQAEKKAQLKKGKGKVKKSKAKSKASKVVVKPKTQVKVIEKKVEVKPKPKATSQSHTQTLLAKKKAERNARLADGVAKQSNPKVVAKEASQLQYDDGPEITMKVWTKVHNPDWTPTNGQKKWLKGTAELSYPQRYRDWLELNTPHTGKLRFTNLMKSDSIARPVPMARTTYTHKTPWMIGNCRIGDHYITEHIYVPADTATSKMQCIKAAFNSAQSRNVKYEQMYQPAVIQAAVEVTPPWNADDKPFMDESQYTYLRNKHVTSCVAVADREPKVDPYSSALNYELYHADPLSRLLPRYVLADTTEPAPVKQDETVIEQQVEALQGFANTYGNINFDQEEDVPKPAEWRVRKAMKVWKTEKARKHVVNSIMNAVEYNASVREWQDKRSQNGLLHHFWTHNSCLLQEAERWKRARAEERRELTRLDQALHDDDAGAWDHHRYHQHWSLLLSNTRPATLFEHWVRKEMSRSYGSDSMSCVQRRELYPEQTAATKQRIRKATELTLANELIEKHRSRQAAKAMKSGKPTWHNPYKLSLTPPAPNKGKAPVNCVELTGNSGVGDKPTDLSVPINPGDYPPAVNAESYAVQQAMRTHDYIAEHAKKLADALRAPVVDFNVVRALQQGFTKRTSSGIYVPPEPA